MNHMNQGDITLQGMILRSTPQGDFDKRLVILTKERGKVTVFARGARRSRNALAGKTNPFSFGSFVVGRGSSAYYLKQAEISNYFMEMSQDYERNCYGCYLLEFADYYTQEESDELQLLKLLYQSLRALIKDSIPNPLIRRIFELKALVINGEYPEIFCCMDCREKLKEGYFSVQRGGVFCEKHRMQVPDGIYINGDLLYTIQYVVSAPIEKLYTFVLKEDVFAEFQAIMAVYCKRYVGHSFKSQALIEELP